MMNSNNAVKMSIYKNTYNMQGEMQQRMMRKARESDEKVYYSSTQDVALQPDGRNKNHGGCKHMKRRILAIVMTMLMLVGLLPINMMCGGDSVRVVAEDGSGDTVIKVNDDFITDMGLYWVEQGDIADKVDNSAELKDTDQIAIKFDYKVKESRLDSYEFIITNFDKIPIKQYQPANVYGSDGTLVATVTVGSSDCKVKFDFAENCPDSYKEAGVLGDFWMGGTFDSSKVGNGGPQKIGFQCGNKDVSYQNIKTAIKQPEVKVNVSKTSDTTTDASSSLIKWTVTMTPDVTNLDSSLDKTRLLKTLTMSDEIQASTIENAYYNNESDATHAPKVTIKQGTNGNETDITSSSAVSCADGKLSLNINNSDTIALQDDSIVTLTYYTKYNKDKIGSGVNVPNTAKAELTPYKIVAKDDSGIEISTTDTTDPVTSENTATANLAGVSLTKEHSGLDDTHTYITWTVTVNNSLQYANPAVQDILAKGLELKADSIKVKEGDNGTESPVTETYKDQNTTYPCYRYTETDGGKHELTVFLNKDKVASKATVTYQTSFSDDALANADSSTKLTNSASFCWSSTGTEPIGDAWSKTAEISKDVPVAGSFMSKSGTYTKSDQTVAWTVDLSNITGRLDSGITIKDKFDTNATYKQWLVKKNDNGALATTDDGSIAGQGENASSYAAYVTLTVGATKYSITPTVTDGSTGFEIKLDSSNNSSEWSAIKALASSNDATDKSVKLTYTTQLDDESTNVWSSNWAADGKTYNTVSVDGIAGKTMSVTGEADISSEMLKKDCTSSYSSTTHKASWKLTVNDNKIDMKGAKVTDTLSTSWSSEVEEKDVPSATHWKYENIVIKESGKDGTTLTSGSDYTATVSNTADGHKQLVIEFNKNDKKYNKTYEITYDTVLDSTHYDDLNTNNTLKLSNEAVLSGDNIYNDVKVTNSTEAADGVLKKTGTIDGLKIKWTVDVNKNRAKIASDDAVSIIDSLPDEKGLMYVDNSVAVKKISTDSTETVLTADTDYTSKYENGILSVTFKDSNNVTNAKEITDYYVITFDTVVTKPGSYSNSISMTGSSAAVTHQNESQAYEIRFSGGSTRIGMDGFGQIIVSKSKASGGVLAGAEFTVYKAGDPVGTITTDDSGKAVMILRNGTYTIKETKAPDGFILSTQERQFTINSSVNDGTWEESFINYEADAKTYKFSKQATGYGTEIIGADMYITTSGNTSTGVRYHWTSDGTTKEYALTDGTYYLIENLAPTGYNLATTIKFTVGEGKITSATNTSDAGLEDGSGIASGDESMLVMMDSYNTGTTKPTLSISKVDTNTSTELSGATLTLTMKNGRTTEQIDSWVSNGYVHVVMSDKLVYQAELTLTEESAPGGYKKAESITFKIVDASGTIYIKQHDGSWKQSTDAANTVVMKDSLINTCDVVFSKVSAGQGRELSGAELTVKNFNTGVVVQHWISDGSTKTFAIDNGEEYVLIEDQAPTGYSIASSIRFKVDNNQVYIYDGGSYVLQSEAKVKMIDEHISGGGGGSKDPKDDKITLDDVKPDSNNSGVNSSDTGAAYDTGDHAPTYMYICVALLAFVVGMTAYKWNKKKKFIKWR